VYVNIQIKEVENVTCFKIQNESNKFVNVYMNKLILAVDIGNTHIKFSVFSQKGIFKKFFVLNTGAELSAKNILKEFKN